MAYAREKACGKSLRSVCSDLGGESALFEGCLKEAAADAGWEDAQPEEDSTQEEEELSNPLVTEPAQESGGERSPKRRKACVDSDSVSSPSPKTEETFVARSGRRRTPVTTFEAGPASSKPDSTCLSHTAVPKSLAKDAPPKSTSLKDDDGKLSVGGDMID